MGLIKLLSPFDAGHAYFFASGEQVRMPASFRLAPQNQGGAIPAFGLRDEAFRHGLWLQW